MKFVVVVLYKKLASKPYFRENMPSDCDTLVKGVLMNFCTYFSHSLIAFVKSCVGDLHRRALSWCEFIEDGCSVIAVFPYFLHFIRFGCNWMLEMSIKISFVKIGAVTF